MVIIVQHHQQSINNHPKIDKPAKKKPKRVRTVEGSCNQCLKKRVKCSLHKPTCERCTKEHHLCTYNKVNLKWGKILNGSSKKTEFLVSEQGRKPMSLLFKGAELSQPKVSNKGLDSISRPCKRASIVKHGNTDHNKTTQFPIATTSCDTLVKYNQQLARTRTRSATTTSTTTILYFDLEIKNKPTSNELLKYFQMMILPRFHAYGETIKGLNLTTISLNPLLDNFGETIAAFHMFNHQTYRLTEIELRQKKSKSVKLLTNELEKIDKDASKLEDLFNCCVLLGTIDGMINTEDSAISPSHLFGSRAILTQLLSSSPLKFINLQEKNVSNLTIRLLSMFNTMDLIYSFLTGNNQTLMIPEFWYNFNETDAWFGRLAKEDPLLRVLEKLSFLSNLGYHIKTTGYLNLIDGNELLLQTKQILEWKSNDTRTVRSIFASAFADVGLIYYYRVFMKMGIDDFEIQNIVNWFIKKIEGGISKQDQDRCNDTDNVLNHCLLLPLLIIGAHCITLENQLFVRDLIYKSFQSLKFMNVTLLLDFLNQFWTLLNNDIGLLNDITWWNQFNDISNCSFIF